MWMAGTAGMALCVAWALHLVARKLLLLVRHQGMVRRFTQWAACRMPPAGAVDGSGGGGVWWSGVHPSCRGPRSEWPPYRCVAAGTPGRRAGRQVHVHVHVCPQQIALPFSDSPCVSYHALQNAPGHEHHEIDQQVQKRNSAWSAEQGGAGGQCTPAIQVLRQHFGQRGQAWWGAAVSETDTATPKLKSYRKMSQPSHLIREMREGSSG